MPPFPRDPRLGILQAPLGRRRVNPSDPICCTWRRRPEPAQARLWGAAGMQGVGERDRCQLGHWAETAGTDILCQGKACNPDACGPSCPPGLEVAFFRPRPPGRSERDGGWSRGGPKAVRARRVPLAVTVRLCPSIRWGNVGKRRGLPSPGRPDGQWSAAGVRLGVNSRHTRLSEHDGKKLSSDTT